MVGVARDAGDGGHLQQLGAFGGGSRVGAPCGAGVALAWGLGVLQAPQHAAGPRRAPHGSGRAPLRSPGRRTLQALMRLIPLIFILDPACSRRVRCGVGLLPPRRGDFPGHHRRVRVRLRGAARHLKPNSPRLRHTRQRERLRLVNTSVNTPLAGASGSTLTCASGREDVAVWRWVGAQRRGKLRAGAFVSGAMYINKTADQAL